MTWAVTKAGSRRRRIGSVSLLRAHGQSISWPRRRCDPPSRDRSTCGLVYHAGGDFNFVCENTNNGTKTTQPDPNWACEHRDATVVDGSVTGTCKGYNSCRGTSSNFAKFHITNGGLNLQCLGDAFPQDCADHKCDACKRTDATVPAAERNYAGGASRRRRRIPLRARRASTPQNSFGVASTPVGGEPCRSHGVERSLSGNRRTCRHVLFG